MSEISFTVGQRVVVPKAGNGTIRFFGATNFAQGKWTGIELDAPNGKNDGSVAGEAYFSCNAGHGMFVRPSQVKLLDDGSEFKVPGTPRSRTTAPTPLRPGATRTPSALSNVSRPPSAAAAASTPTNRDAPLLQRMQSKTPGSITAAAARRPIPPSPAVMSRTMSASSAGSTQDSMPRSRTTPSSSLPSNRPSSAASSAVQTPQIDEGRFGEDALESPFLPATDKQLNPDEQPPAPPSPSVLRSPMSLQDKFAKRQDQTVSLRVHEECLLRLRMLEARQAENKERLKELDYLRTESDTWNAARPKLQAKIIELNSESKELKKMNKDLDAELQACQKQLGSLTDELESATLDREMAEEKLDAAEALAEGLKEKLADAEEMTAVLKEHACTLLEMVTSARFLLFCVGQPKQSSKYRLAMRTPQ